MVFNSFDEFWAFYRDQYEGRVLTEKLAKELTDYSSDWNTEESDLEPEESCSHRDFKDTQDCPYCDKQIKISVNIDSEDVDLEMR